MKEPVHVTVQMATVGIPVEVSALHEVEQVMHYIVSSVPRTFVLCYLALGHALSPREILIRSFIASFLLFSACTRTCQNGGTLDAGTCTCDCAGGFSGPSCESECIVCRVDLH